MNIPQLPADSSLSDGAATPAIGLMRIWALTVSVFLTTSLLAASAASAAVNITPPPGVVPGTAPYQNVVAPGDSFSTTDSTRSWLRCTDASGVPPFCTSQGSGASYTVADADLGYFIKLQAGAGGAEYSNAYYVAPATSGSATISPALSTPTTTPMPGTTWDVFAQSTVDKSALGVGAGFTSGLVGTLSLAVDYGGGFQVVDTCSPQWGTQFGGGSLADLPCVMGYVADRFLIPADAGGKPYRVTLASPSVRGTTVTGALDGTVGGGSSSGGGGAGGGGTGGGGNSGGGSGGSGGSGGGGGETAPAKPKVKWKANKKKRTVSATVTGVSGVAYSISASSGKKKKSGKCSPSGARRTCTIKLAKGRWSVSVIPKRGALTGPAATKSLKL